MAGETPPIYVVDDDPLIRRTIDGILSSEGYEVSCYASGRDFLEAAPGLPRGCVLLDVMMPDMDGIQVLEKLDEHGLTFPIVMISGHGDISTAVKAVRAGAIDFIEKPFKPDQLLQAAKDAGLQSAERPPAPPLSQTPIGVLSAREVQVLQHLVEGDSNKVVAHKLGISQRTVEVHRAKIMERLEVSSFAELIRMAVAAGL